MAADLAMECIQDYIHPDDETLQSTIEMTPGFKPFTCILFTQIVNGNVLREGLLFRDFL